MKRVEKEAPMPREFEQAVIDRIEDGEQAVLIAGEDERMVIVPLEQLPEGAGAGTWLQVRWAGETLLEAEIDAEQTERARARIAAKLDKLRQRGRAHGPG
jgi:hypothetical protein